MTTNVLKSFAKINLALHVTGKLTNLHKIESIVKFIDLHDTISINEINSYKHEVSFIGNFSKKIKEDNTVNKLFEILEKKNFLKKKKFQVKIKKKYSTRVRSWWRVYECGYNFKFFNQKKIYKD
jgi:4-diphosphocytidyl-2-C-methyl-D-erythritol kinase